MERLAGTAAARSGSSLMFAQDWKHSALARATRAKSRWRTVYSVTSAIVAALALFALGRTWEAAKQRTFHLRPGSAIERSWAFQGGAVDTLVVYIFSGSDPAYAGNLRFFLRWGVTENDGAQYIVVLQQSQEAEVAPTALMSAPLLVALEVHLSRRA